MLQRTFGIAPRRPAGKRPMVFSICNFKGGVAKTTTTPTWPSTCACTGYRVLAVDLDAQASLTQTFGLLPHTEVGANQTARPYFEGPVYPNGDRTRIGPVRWPRPFKRRTGISSI